MTEVSDQDWMQVNAYHDGEMLSRDRSAFEKRLQSEPELAAALDSVRDVGRSLGPLRPQLDAAEKGHDLVLSRWKWAAGGALAASILVAAFGVLPDKGTGASQIHAAFLDQTFVVESGDLHLAASGSTFPNLGAANLTFVAARETDVGTAAHYAGRNGCRLTFLTMSEPIRMSSKQGMQIQQWSFGQRHFAILASGMDTGKFAAIGDLLMEETRKAAQPDTVLALRDATEAANRCA